MLLLIILWFFMYKKDLRSAGLSAFEIYTSIICSLQSTHAILTSLVALTLIPQTGQMYFLVLEVLGGGVTPTPL